MSIRVSWIKQVKLTVLPQTAQALLSTDIPNCEHDVLILDRFNIEAYIEVSTFEYQEPRQDEPMVGMVVTTSPSLSLKRMVVLPAPSSPS
jgi:hypothetical protein